MNAEKLIRGTLAHIDKSLDNVADLDVVWGNAEVVAVLEEVRSLLVTGEINPGSFEKAQAPTDDEREDMIAWLMRDQGDDLSPLGRDYTDAEIADMLRRTAQTEPTPFNGKWVCGKCDREVAQGVDDGQIPEHHRTCPKRAQTEPTDAQVEAGVRALYEYAGLEVYPDEMRVVLKAAFAAGQEEQS